MSIRFDDQVAIVTGAGGGIGKEHALELARRGAKVVVNDLGGSVDGSGTSDAAEAVVQQIKDAGGEAIANGASVTDLSAIQDMVKEVMDKWLDKNPKPEKKCLYSKLLNTETPHSLKEPRK